MGLCRRLGNCDSDLPQDVTYYYTAAPFLHTQLLVPSSILLTRAQKLLIASGGKPLLFSAVKVKSLGSSQSLSRKELFYSYFTDSTLYSMKEKHTRTSPRMFVLSICCKRSVLWLQKVKIRPDTKISLYLLYISTYWYMYIASIMPVVFTCNFCEQNSGVNFIYCIGCVILFYSIFY